MTPDLAQIIQAIEQVSDPRERLQRYRSLSASYPTSAQVWLNLATHLAQQGSLDEARQALQRALDLDPSLRDRLSGTLQSLLPTRISQELPTAILTPSSSRPSVEFPQPASALAAEPAPFFALPAPGHIIGKWRLGRVLGEGEFGTVFEATHTVIDGHRAAVKVLRPHKALDPMTVRRFINEASAASTANHENIIRVYDGDASPGGLCYLAMELLRGAMLRQRLRQGPLPVASTIRIATQIAEALDAAHQIRIVHRDLKPDNVALSDRPNRPDFVTLFDFGIARLRDAAEEAAQMRTRSGVIMGTPDYMSPEQWKGLSDIDHRADVYALGILLYECLSGRTPFSGNLYECMRAHIEDPVPALPDIGSATGPLMELIRAMLAKEREGRPASMRVVVETLEAIAEEHVPRVRAPSAIRPAASSDSPTLIEPPPAEVAALLRAAAQAQETSSAGGTLFLQPKPAAGVPTVALAGPTTAPVNPTAAPAEAITRASRILDVEAHRKAEAAQAPGTKRRRTLLIVGFGGVVGIIGIALTLGRGGTPPVASPEGTAPAQGTASEASGEAPQGAPPTAPAAEENPPAAKAPEPPAAPVVAAQGDAEREETPAPPASAAKASTEKPEAAAGKGSTGKPGAAAGATKPDRPVRYELVIDIPSGTPEQKQAIQKCIRDGRLPQTYEIGLQRSGTLIVTRGREKTTQAFRDCIKETFQVRPAPPSVSIKRFISGG